MTLKVNWVETPKMRTQRATTSTRILFGKNVALVNRQSQGVKKNSLKNESFILGTRKSMARKFKIIFPCSILFWIFPKLSYKICCCNFKSILFLELLDSIGLIILEDPCKFQARHLEFDTRACLIIQVTFFFKSVSRIFKPPYN